MFVGVPNPIYEGQTRPVQVEIIVGITLSTKVLQKLVMDLHIDTQ